MEKQIDDATQSTREIASWKSLNVYRLLRNAETQRSAMEGAVNKAFADSRSVIYRPSAVLSVPGLIPDASFHQALEMIRGFNAMGSVFLLVNRMQQRLQALGTTIERKHAYAFGFISLYIGLVLSVAGLILSINAELQNRTAKAFDEMVRSRPYDDRPNVSPSQREQELMNRTVQVQLVRAGLCERLVRSED